MDKARARELLKTSIQSNGDIAPTKEDYWFWPIAWGKERPDEVVMRDVSFQVEELEALLWWIGYQSGPKKEKQ